MFVKNNILLGRGEYSFILSDNSINLHLMFITPLIIHVYKDNATCLKR